METSLKLFIGTDAAGRRLKAAIKQFAEEKYFGSMSRLLVRDFCEKYGFDPRTGKRSSFVRVTAFRPPDFKEK